MIMPVLDHGAGFNGRGRCLGKAGYKVGTLWEWLLRGRCWYDCEASGLPVWANGHITHCMGILASQ